MVRQNRYMEQSKLLHNKYDALFKHIIGAEWCVKSDGNVESPSGYFALVEIPSHTGEFAEMLDAINTGLPESMQFPEEDWPEPGWYVTMETEAGTIWVASYPSKSIAEQTYQTLAKHYNEWATEDEG